MRKEFDELGIFRTDITKRTKEECKNMILIVRSLLDVRSS